MDAKRERILKKYENVINEDAELQKESEEQRPLSRAYLSICPFNRAQN